MISTAPLSLRSALLAIGLLACVDIGTADTPAHAQGRERGADARACASFGLRSGTRGYNACIEELQRRAEASRLSSLEEMALTSRIALEGQIMAERARRQRCERDPDRRECRRN